MGKIDIFAVVIVSVVLLVGAWALVYPFQVFCSKGMERAALHYIGVGIVSPSRDSDSGTLVHAEMRLAEIETWANTLPFCERISYKNWVWHGRFKIWMARLGADKERAVNRQTEKISIPPDRWSTRGSLDDKPALWVRPPYAVGLTMGQLPPEERCITWKVPGEICPEGSPDWTRDQ